MARKQVVDRTSPKITSPTLSNIDYIRPELAYLLPSYDLIRDVIEGEIAIKGWNTRVTLFTTIATTVQLSINNIDIAKAKKYLPQPNAEDVSDANQKRYRNYVARAVFYGVTSRTLEGMAGQIFLRDPVVTLPPELEIMIDDADGAHNTLAQVANNAVVDCIGYGRCGLLVDFPITSGPITKKQITDGEMKPTFTIYHPWDIINWRTKKINGKCYITMLVLREFIDNESDDFALIQVEQFRVFRLTDAGVTVQIFRKDKTAFNPSSIIIPKNASGNALDEIPFMFLGSKNNEAKPNQPPLYDLASLNIAHYRNSADFEESSFMCGQPTPVFTGVDEFWVKNVWRDEVTLGSRAAIPLPINAKAELLQADPNNLPNEAMKHKEEQMIGLGARLIQDNSISKTATQDIIDTTSESSMLANVSKNVSSGFLWAFGVAADFVGAAKDAIVFKLNKDFDVTSMTADDQNAIIKQWQSAGISFKEMRDGLRRAGTAIQDDDEARKQIQQDIKDGMIPDPTLTNAPPLASTAKPASDAGGPQPGSPRPGVKP